jgi:hypothetical protein
MTIPLAPGEPLYTTDQGFLYIGNGTTPGGVQVTGYGDENAVDAVGAALVAGEHQNIQFIYGQTQDVANRIDAIIDLTTYNGEISATGFKGTIIADDNTVAFDSSTKVLNATNVISENISVGDVTAENLTVTNLTVTSSSSLFVDVIGSVFANDSTLLVDGLNGRLLGPLIGDVTGNLTGNVVGNVVGDVVGDLKGSVFGDDSSVIIDSVNNQIFGSLFGSLTTNNLTIEANRLISLTNNVDDAPIFYIDESEAFIRVLPGKAGFELNGIVDPLEPSANNVLTSFVSRGTVEDPEIVQQGDSLSGNIALAYDGDDFILTGFSGFVVDSNFTPAQGSVKSVYAISFPERNVPDDNVFTADTRGVFTTPVAMQFTPLADISARDAALPTPTAGMMVFVTSVAKFQGYDGTSWVDLN